MSTLSISPFSSSPLHSFRLPKSSSGRSNCGSDADWSSAFASSNSFNLHDEQQQRDERPQQSQQHLSTALYGSHHTFAPNAAHSEQQPLDDMPRSTSFPHLASSPSFFSPLDAQSSSPTLVSPKLFSPLDSLSPPRIFASSNRLLDLASPAHLSPSPLFAGGLSVSPRHGSHHSSLTASLSARHPNDPFTSAESSSQSCPADSFVPSAATASTSSSTTSHVRFQQDTDVDMAPAGAPSAASNVRLSTAQQQRSSPSSALSDMSNDHYLSFEVLNIDAMTGHIKTEETAFSPANAAVFDFVSLQQPLQDALTSNNENGASSSASSSVPSPASVSASASCNQQRDYAYPALNFDDADAELLSRASSPASQFETEDALDRITSPPDSSFFSSHARHHHAHDGQHNQSIMPSPFTLPPTSTRHIRSYSSRASKRSLSSHSQSQSTPSTPQYSPTADQPSMQLQTDLTLLQSSVSHMNYQQRVKFVESFKALADKGEPAATSADGESSGMDPAVLNLIFSPADAAVDELEQDDEDESQSDVDGDEEMMDEEGRDLPSRGEYAGERLTGRRRKRLHVPSSPTRRFSVPALRTSHPGSHVSGHPFPPLSPSLSVSSHNSSSSSPIPRSFASGSDEDSFHANSPHPRMAAAVSVMAQQITPVQATRMGVSATAASSANNVTTATAVVEEVMNALPVSPSAVVTAEAVTAASPVMSPPSTPTAAMAVALPAAAVKAKPSKVAITNAVVVDGAVSAAAVSASPVQSAAAVPATLASAASPIHRARVLPAVPPRQAYALPHSKKLKTGKPLPAQQLYGSPVAACVAASAVSAVSATVASYAQPMHATAVQASAVDAKGWRAMK